MYQNLGTFDFIFENLYQGSVINYRLFLLEDNNYVNIRATSRMTILQLSLPQLEDIKTENPGFAKTMNVLQNDMLKSNKKYPLDYFLSIDNKAKINKKHARGILKRENILKNVVFRRMEEIGTVVHQ